MMGHSSKLMSFSPVLPSPVPLSPVLFGPVTFRTILSGIIVLTLSIAPAFSEPVELTHLPPTARAAQGVVTIEVQAPAVSAIRMLVNDTADRGIQAYPLTLEGKSFRVRLRGNELIGRQYSFQVRTTSGEVRESDSYTVRNDGEIALLDEVEALRFEIAELDRSIAQMRREVTVARAQKRATETNRGIDPLRAQAAALLSEGWMPSMQISEGGLR